MGHSFRVGDPTVEGRNGSLSYRKISSWCVSKRIEFIDISCVSASCITLIMEFLLTLKKQT